ncbi:epimerase [Spiractinospora alimapuensis]|uniref:NAD-dependent epimerase/dehydratase family protein n=1 Tax=Spiractinospora alimapuensis TaxID=2820884 RepID=UPI001F2C8C61|nr:NAD-dependent epimerase/dehydratase family protein [Spiractinospora alimapuensis]QVQ51489.1 epimerase [Spiractinospora alimapuensis]
MEILLLGGTAFLGRHIAVAAAARGHEVTCVARGSNPAPDGIELVVADRDEDQGLAPVGGHHWDAVIDVSRQPGQVRRAVRDLHCSHWVFVSSGNVYADFSALEQDERSAVRAPLEGDVMEDMSSYGESKVACEAAIRSAGSSSTIVRSGLIGGPDDDSGRSGYWPWRFAHSTGDDVIVPDDPGFPCAMIDVRDLAAWIVSAAEQRLDGVFNATGPTISLGEVLAVSAQAARSQVPARPVPAARLAELGVGCWMGPASLPLWIDKPDWRGFATLDTTRARANGLVTRPLLDTLRDALAYENRRGGARRTGLDDAEERRVRAALDGNI